MHACAPEEAEIPLEVRVFLAEVGDAVREVLAKRSSETRTMEASCKPTGEGNESGELLLG